MHNCKLFSKLLMLYVGCLYAIVTFKFLFFASTDCLWSATKVHGSSHRQKFI